MGALEFVPDKTIPLYDALFIDEAQDLLEEEVQLIRNWSRVIFFVGDDRQKLYPGNAGLDAVRQVIPEENTRTLNHHYRLAPEICQMADRILVPPGGKRLATTDHYQGPRPATITFHQRVLSKNEQVKRMISRLRQQMRVYDVLIQSGDRLGVVVGRRDDREFVFNLLDGDATLSGKSKVLRAKDSEGDAYDPSLDSDCPICILTLQGAKGLEFRAVHWLFADDLQQYRKAEHYYTVVTRAKTSFDVYFSHTVPQVLSRAYAPPGAIDW